jgi:ADP-dependent NAD(P)H-hydrate dehydratase / NAD(P)H-hydrate epimerase
LFKIVSVETMRKIEAAADAGGLSYDAMMQNAGRAVSLRAISVITKRVKDEQARVTVLVGPGNNGGDGLVAARLIAQEGGALVRCYLLKKRDENDPHLKAAREAGLFIAEAEDDQRYRVLTNMVASAHVIVDALFGIGMRLPIAGDAEKLLRAIHKALGVGPETGEEQVIITADAPDSTPRASAPYVIAVDCPSGLNADTGEIDQNAIHADETVTFIAAKPGLFIFPGAEAVGKLTLAQIGVPEDTEGLKGEQRVIVDAQAARDLLPPRPDGSHKGTFGKVLIVGGSVNYTGAPGLAAEAAYRVGAGLVVVGAPSPVVAALQAHLLEPTWILLPHDMGVVAESATGMIREEAAKAKALLIGPGFGREKTTGEMLKRLLEKADADKRNGRRAIGFMASRQESAPENETENAPLPPLVIDADALYLLSQIENWWTLLPENTVITPHPGEMAQLTGMETNAIQADRWTVAAQKATEWNLVLVLKGAHTLIAEPGGRVAVLPFKTAALATAGTGDVLAGIIAGLLAQGLSAFDAAVAGGYLHGLAGQQMATLVGARGTLAGDMVRFGLPQAIRQLEGN